MIDYDNMDCKEYTITNTRFGHNLISKMSVFLPIKRKDPGLDLNKKLLVDTVHLQELLDCGYHTAVKIGTDAHALIKIERKLFWNVEIIKKYLNSDAE